MNFRSARVGGLSAFTLAASAVASVSFSGSYTQSFDGLFNSGNTTLTGRGPFSLDGNVGGGLVSTGMAGWTGANFDGSSGNTEVRAQNGSQSGSAGRGVVSFGQTGSTERALGALPTSNQINQFGVTFSNTSGSTITQLEISFYGEQWRAGDAGVSNTLSFFYGLGGGLISATTSFAALDFSSPNTAGGNAALDGNAAANRQLISATITGLNWSSGATLTLRWNMNEVSGQDTGLAIDDFSMAIPTPGAVALLGLAGLTARRRN